MKMAKNECNIAVFLHIYLIGNSIIDINPISFILILNKNFYSLILIHAFLCASQSDR